MLWNIFEEQFAENLGIEWMLNIAQNYGLATLVIVYILDIIDRHALHDRNPTNLARLAFL